MIGEEYNVVQTLVRFQVIKKKKEKEKEKGKTASVRSDPLGRERAGPIRSALAIWD